MKFIALTHNCKLNNGFFQTTLPSVANTADVTPISKKNPFNVTNDEQDDNIATPNIHIQRHKIPAKSFSFKIQDDTVGTKKEENDFNLQSGAILSSSSNYSFVSSDGLDDRRKAEETRKPPIEIKSFEIAKPKPRLYTSPLKVSLKTSMKEDSGFETSCELSEVSFEIINNGDVLVQLKSLFYKYENLIVDLDNRLELMHESLLCDFINRDD